MRANLSVGLSVLVTAFMVNVSPLTAAPSPPTRPAPSGAAELSERQRSLLLQLADAEANVKELNRALVRTGYKVGLAYDQIESNEKGNEYMDRNGGGPVRWDAFYGHTANEYNKNGGTFDHRPRQFDYVYKANADQIAKAKQRVASLVQDQGALLTRRSKHESDEVCLWATLAWERINDREIAYRPLYRFRLKPSGGRASLLRAPILFLRQADRITARALETIEADPENTFVDMGDQIKDAYSVVQESIAIAVLGADVRQADRERADALKALCKQLNELCAVTADDWRKAMDADRNNEDASKLQFRGDLQRALMKFAVASAELDEQVQKVAEAWGITPELGVESPDRVPADANAGDNARPASGADTMPASKNPGSSPAGGGIVRRPKAAKTVDLLTCVDTARDPIRGTWAMDRGELRPVKCEDDHGPFVELPVEPIGSYALHMNFQFLNGTDALYMHVPVGTTWGLLVIGHQRQTFENIRGVGAVGGGEAFDAGLHHLDFEVRQSRPGEIRISASVDSKALIEWNGSTSLVENDGEVWKCRDPAAFAVGCKAVIFRSITLEMMSGSAKMLRAH